MYIEIYRYINAASTQCSGDVNPMCCSHTVGTLYVGLCGGKTRHCSIFFLSFSHFTSQAEASRPDVVLVLVNGVGSF